MDRNVARGATVIVFALMALAPAAAVAQEIKVTLLGTGTPVPAMNRFGPSILVEAAGQKFLSTPAEVRCSAWPSSGFAGRT